MLDSTVCIFWFVSCLRFIFVVICLSMTIARATFLKSFIQNLELLTDLRETSLKEVDVVFGWLDCVTCYV